MTDQFFPADLIPNEVEWGIVDGTGISQSPTVLTTRTATSYGNRVLACRMTFREKSERERARIMAIIQRGRADRFWLTDVSTPLAGSMSAPELLANNAFANGTTGWEAYSSQSSLAVSDRVARPTLTTNGSAGIDNPSSISLAQGIPYVGRAFVTQGRGALGSGVIVGTTKGSATNGNSDTSTSVYGLRTTALVPSATGSYFLYAGAIVTSGAQAGDYVSIAYTSLARGGLADNGLNAFLQSDTLATTWSASAASISSNAAAAPDGAVTGDQIVESGTNAAHFISQTTTRVAAVEDWCAYGYFKLGTGANRDIRLAIGSDGSNLAVCIFNLAAGTAGIPAVGGTVTNARAYISPAGSGWYFCCVIGTLASNTGAYVEAVLVNAGATSYAGNGTSGVHGWRVGGAKSSVPTRGALTTSTATTGTAQTGSGLYIKGLFPSTSGLLKLNDLVEINGELKRTTASLDSDAAGLGYLQFEPQMRTPTVDNAPVIFNRPMGKFMLANDRITWPSRPGRLRKARSDFDLEFVEAP